MATYTVHEPRRKSDDTLAHAARFVFVRDGFHWWAFLLTPLWMLRHRLWLEFIAYVAVTVALTILLGRLGVPSGAGSYAIALLSLLVGIEASSLRRWKLARRGFTNLGVVVGDDRESAERRFFDAWIKNRVSDDAERSPPQFPPAPPRPANAGAPDIVGLFPQPPGARA